MGQHTRQRERIRFMLIEITVVAINLISKTNEHGRHKYNLHQYLIPVKFFKRYPKFNIALKKCRFAV